ncbi:MAG: cytochrome c3 family protein [Polyangiales bacterium]
MRNGVWIAIALTLIAALFVRREPEAASTKVLSPQTTVDPLAAFVLDAAPIDWSLKPNGGLAQTPGYVGSGACARCHTKIAERFEASPMANTGLHRLAKSAELDALFDGTREVKHAASGFVYRPFRDGDGYWLEERLDAPDGKLLHRRLERVTLSFTAGTSGLSFGFERGGRIHNLPIDFYPRERAWGLDPGFVKNARFSGTLGATCIGCHSEPTTHVAGNETMLRGELRRGIGCERCHGPGAKHLETSSGADLVNPSRLSFARQLELCAQCHVEGAAEVTNAGEGSFDYVAGTKLASHQVIWVDEKPSPTSFGLVSAADRLVRSACFQASKGALVCTSCHDPHGGPDKPVQAVCIGCHETRKRAQCNGSCTSCHMARGTPSDFAERVPGIPLSKTDHWIRRTVPSAIDNKSAHPTAIVPLAQLVSNEPFASPPESRAIALFWTGLDASPALLSVAKEPPAHPALYRAIGDVYEASIQRDASLLPRLRLARAMEVKLAPDDVDALVRYAKVATDGEAEKALGRASSIAPEDEAALLEMGGLLLRLGREHEAFAFLERAAVVGTDVVEAHVLLGVRANVRGDLHAAAEHFTHARKEAPRDRFILEQLLALDHMLGDATAEAEVAHALRFVPADSRPSSAKRSTHWLEFLTN